MVDLGRHHEDCELAGLFVHARVDFVHQVDELEFRIGFRVLAIQQVIDDLPVQSGRAGATDITYIPMRHGYLSLVAVMDWFSRYVLSWRLSNSIDVEFCLEALEEALSHD